MPRIDLNIVDRQTQGSTWVAQNTPISADALDKVLEQQTNNATALNSLPTPFARFFVAREAFRKAKAEKLNPKNKAGKAYNRLVSDILDVYELLFDLKYHRNVWGDSSDVEIREWDFAQNMAVMKESMPVLYNSINEYYPSDINQDKLYFIVYKEDGKEYLWACSSPITGFVTPPDLDKIEICEKGVVKEVPAGENYKNLRIHRKSGGFFFDGKKSFEDRRPDFKNYMYNQLFGQGGLSNQFKEIRDFILSFNTDSQIRNNFQLQLSPINTVENTQLSINGLKLFEQSGVDINSYFNDYLIRLPYKLSKENYEGVVYGADDRNRDYDFMWPFSPNIVKLYPNGVIDAHIDIRRNDVKVTIKYNDEEYVKTYSENPTDRDGKILDLKRHKINFDLGIFPNILSHKSEENKYFKVLVIGADQRREGPYFNINKISLSFYKNGDDISEVDLDTTAKYGVYPAVVRSRQKVDEGEDHPFLEGGTKFYELFNTSFDMIEVTILGEAKGLLMPKWKKSNSTNKNYTYAIDFGTSNTFVSRCENTERGEPNLDMKPQQFNMEATMVNYMHEMSSQSHFSMVERIEDSIFDAARNRIKTEFVPTIIDGDVYKFPIRTAICGIRNKSNAPRLFDNHNIAFFYNNMMVHDDQTVSTNIKWSDNEQLISVFIRELLLMIKCDILQRDGDLDCTKLVWFSPLSFSGNVKSMYERIWVREAQDILGINEDKIKQYSESEAPYYYYKKMNYIPDTEAVSVVDIGGGSTDFVYFKDNKPVVANSVHFGCDVLWDNGFVEFGNNRENGIYQKYHSTLKFGNNKNLENLNICLQDEKSSQTTRDIINFWLSNDNYCNITSKLNDDFKPVFVYHLASILFYMASMYKDNGMAAPKTIVFSGNGSKYIDNFISKDITVIEAIVNKVFGEIFGGEHKVNIKLPEERKESTCYGGLYRNADEPRVESIVYHGDNSANYKNVEDVNQNFDKLSQALVEKYAMLADIYKEILTILKNKNVLDTRTSTERYENKVKEDMLVPLKTYYTSEIKDKYDREVACTDSVFFLPVIDRVFEMTKI